VFYPPGWSVGLPLDPGGGRIITLDAVSGLGLAPRSITSDPDPIGGSRVRHIQRQARRIIWPQRFRSDTLMGLKSQWRQYGDAYALTDELGPGILRITYPDGSVREIEAYYESGFDGEPGQGHTYDTAVTVLYCPDPLFRDPTPVVLTRSYVASPSVYLNPYRTFGTGQVLDESTLTNPGTVDAWPTWVLTGPATELTATNLTTGESFTVTYTLSAGQTITITTRPSEIIGPAGQNLINSMDWPSSKLWRLQRGANDVDLAVLGAGSGTSVTATFYARYQQA
jgi:hypothetical protein